MLYALREAEAEQERREVIRNEEVQQRQGDGQRREEVLIDADGAKACPKCRKHLGRGAHFHVRACKG